MAIVTAKCTNCGAVISVDDARITSACSSCHSRIITKKAIMRYNPQAVAQPLPLPINSKFGFTVLPTPTIMADPITAEKATSLLEKLRKSNNIADIKENPTTRKTLPPVVKLPYATPSLINRASQAKYIQPPPGMTRVEIARANIAARKAGMPIYAMPPPDFVVPPLPVRPMIQGRGQQMMLGGRTVTPINPNTTLTQSDRVSRLRALVASAGAFQMPQSTVSQTKLLAAGEKVVYPPPNKYSRVHPMAVPAPEFVPAVEKKKVNTRAEEILQRRKKAIYADELPHTLGVESISDNESYYIDSLQNKDTNVFDAIHAGSESQADYTQLEKTEIAKSVFESLKNVSETEDHAAHKIQTESGVSTDGEQATHKNQDESVTGIDSDLSGIDFSPERAEKISHNVIANYRNLADTAFTNEKYGEAYTFYNKIYEREKNDWEIIFYRKLSGVCAHKINAEALAETIEEICAKMHADNTLDNQTYEYNQGKIISQMLDSFNKSVDGNRYDFNYAFIKASVRAFEAVKHPDTNKFLAGMVSDFYKRLLVLMDNFMIKLENGLNAVELYALKKTCFDCINILLYLIKISDTPIKSYYKNKDFVTDLMHKLVEIIPYYVETFEYVYQGEFKDASSEGLVITRNKFGYDIWALQEEESKKILAIFDNYVGILKAKNKYYKPPKIDRAYTTPMRKKRIKLYKKIAILLAIFTFVIFVTYLIITPKQAFIMVAAVVLLIITIIAFLLPKIDQNY